MLGAAEFMTIDGRHMHAKQEKKKRLDCMCIRTNVSLLRTTSSAQVNVAFISTNVVETIYLFVSKLSTRLK